MGKRVSAFQRVYLRQDSSPDLKQSKPVDERCTNWEFFGGTRSSLHCKPALLEFLEESECCHFQMT